MISVRNLICVILQLWFAEVLRDAFAAQLAGVFAPFADFAGHHLARRVATNGNSSTTPEEAATKLAQAWSSSAEPYPDISPGLTEFQMAGMKLAILTNGSVKIATSVVEKTGLLSKEHSNTPASPSTESITNDTIAIFDINETLAWKPAKESYHFVCNALALPRSEVMLVASHPWDVNGALQAGLKAAYIQRDPKDPYPTFLDQPQIVVKDFKELAHKILVDK